MSKKNNVVDMRIDDLEALSRLTMLPRQEMRQAERRREHRREKRLQLGIDIGFITVVCACAFVIGFCVGGMA